MQTDFVSQYAFRLIMPLKYLIILLLAFASCTADSRHPQLAMADAVMESAPDSAMTILADVDTAALSQSDKAYYSLLYTQAQIKTWVDLDSDSLFRQAYEAFRDHDNANLRMRAHFYNAQIAYNRGDMQSSMSDILPAYEIAKSEHDPYWTAKSAEIMGDIFSKTYNYPQAERYTTEAAQKYKEAGRELNHRYALADLAVVYSNQRKNEIGLALVDSLKTVVENEQPVDSALMGYICHAAVPLLFEARRLDEVRVAFDTYLVNFYGNEESAQAVLYRSFLDLENGDVQKANAESAYALRLAREEDEHASVLYGLYCNAQAQGDYRSAALLCDSLLWLESRIVKRVVNESITVLQRDFYNQKALIEKKKSRTLAVLLSMSICGTLIIIILLIVVYRLKIRTKNAELSARLSEFLYLKAKVERINHEKQQLRDSLSSSSAALIDLRQQLDDKSQNEIAYGVIVEQLYHNQWNTFNSLCNSYFDVIEAGQNPTKIVKDIERELKDFKNPKNFKSIEQAVDRYFGGIMTILRSEMCGLKEDDIVLLSLIFAGFSVRAICLILDIKYKNFYLRKSRIVRRISDSDTEHKELFLQRLCK